MKAKNIANFLRLNNSVHIADAVFEHKGVDLDCLEEFLESDFPIITIQKYLLIPKINLKKYDFFGNKDKLQNFYSNLLNYLELEDKIGSYSDGYRMNPDNCVFENFPVHVCGGNHQMHYGQMFFDSLDSQIELAININSLEYKNSLFNESEKTEFHEQLTKDIVKTKIKKEFKNRTEISIVPYSLAEIEENKSLNKLKFPLQDLYKLRK